MANVIHSLLGSSIVLLADGSVDMVASRQKFEEALVAADQKATEKFQKDMVSARDTAMTGFDAGLEAWKQVRETWVPRIRAGVEAVFARYSPGGEPILKPALVDRTLTHLLENGGVEAKDARKVTDLIADFISEESAKVDASASPLGLVHVKKGRTGGGVHLTRKNA